MVGEGGNTQPAPDVADDGGGRVARAPLTHAYLFDRYLTCRWSSHRIAEESGWSSQVVRDRLREFGVPVRPRAGGPRSGGTADAAAVVALCEQGISVAEICRRTGYTRQGVYRVLNRHDRRPARPTADAAALSEREEAARLYRQGLSLSAVGARFGRGPDWAGARVQAAGVILRPGGTRRGSGALKAGAVRQLLDEGLTVAEIADRLRFPAHTVRWVIRAQGWPSPWRANFAVRPAEEDVRRLYVAQRRTIAATAAALGTSVHQVKAALDAAGIQRRPRGLQKMFDADAATLTRLYLDQQVSVMAIAARYGCAQETVCKALARHGIVRDLNWQMDAATLRTLYVEQRLDDVAIGARYAIPPYRVRKRRQQLGVRRPRSGPPRPAPPPTLDAERLRALYVDQGRTLAQIAHAHHTSVKVVRGWMRAAGVPVKGAHQSHPSARYRPGAAAPLVPGAAVERHRDRGGAGDDRAVGAAGHARSRDPGALDPP
jgi:transposase-like protein